MKVRKELLLRKMVAVSLLLAAVGLSVAVAWRMERYSDGLGDACIEDTLRKAIDGWLLPFTNSQYVLNALMVLDSLLIDLVLCAVGLYWVFTGTSLSWLYALIAFYVIRALVLSSSSWPQPTPYLFFYPGFPSFFVSYAKTNDLFFSGHTGMSVIMLFDAWLNRRLVLFLVANGLLLLTVMMLFVVGAHFLNDILVGFLVGACAALLAFRHRFDLTLLVLRGLSAVEAKAVKVLNSAETS